MKHINLTNRTNKNEAEKVVKGLVSIIIVNYNGIQFIDGNLKSLEKQTYPNIEIIFIDNNSVDGSLDYVTVNFPKIKLVQNQKNMGFTANNQGIEIANGEYIVLINNDTLVDPFFIEELVKVADQNLSFGMVAPKILTMADPNLIDSAGGLRIYPDGMSRQRGRLEQSDLYNTQEEVFVPSGCACLYKKAMLDEIGYFDEEFFAYCEDTDLGFRARLAGWKTIYNPKAVIYHYGSGSSGQFSSFKAFLVERNHLWFAIKCFPPLKLLSLPFYSLYRYGVQIYGILTHKGIGGEFVKQESKFSLLKIFIKAYWKAFVGLPTVLKKRKEVQKLRKVSNKEVNSWFKIYRISAKDLILKA